MQNSIVKHGWLVHGGLTFGVTIKTNRGQSSNDLCQFTLYYYSSTLLFYGRNNSGKPFNMQTSINSINREVFFVICIKPYMVKQYQVFVFFPLYHFLPQVCVLRTQQVAYDLGLDQSLSINPLPKFSKPVTTKAPEIENFLGPPECLEKG